MALLKIFMGLALVHFQKYWLLIQGLLMEQVYAPTKMGGAGSITPGPAAPRIQRPWPLIKVVFPVLYTVGLLRLKDTLSFTLKF